jgi:hypothetical protein
MDTERRDLLDVLKTELAFLEKGGYSGSVFGAPTVAVSAPFRRFSNLRNYGARDHSEPCSKCVLMQVVSPRLREERIPCRHIPLNEQGETLDSLYRYADRLEIEKAFGTWLRSAISKLEEEDQRWGPVGAVKSPDKSRNGYWSGIDGAGSVA